jgi:hypothetical protein
MTFQGNGSNILEITASNHDDCTVKISGAIEAEVETHHGDLSIEVGDRYIGIAWYGYWTVDDDFHREDGAYTKEETDDGLKVVWSLDKIESVDLTVMH